MMDVLSDVLSNLRLTGSLYFRSELAGPWSIGVKRIERHIRFHLLLSGSCHVAVDGMPPIQMVPGDAVVVPHGTAHILSDMPGRPPLPLGRAMAEGGLAANGVLRILNGRPEPDCRLLCGYCEFDGGLTHPLFATLPTLLRLRPGESWGWLEDAIRFLADDAAQGTPGLAAIASRLLEMLFIQAVRNHTEREGDTPSFMSALADRHLSRALEAMHANPEADWSLERLAAIAALSRSRFAELFQVQLGVPPMRYLAEWRLHRARRLLTETDLSVAEVAYRTGYSSLPAFTRRFTAAFGVGPGRFRRQAA